MTVQYLVHIRVLITFCAKFCSLHWCARVVRGGANTTVLVPLTLLMCERVKRIYMGSGANKKGTGKVREVVVAQIQLYVYLFLARVHVV